MLTWKSQRVIGGLVTGGVVVATAFLALALRRGESADPRSAHACVGPSARAGFAGCAAPGVL
jgi:hypothetical protein